MKKLPEISLLFLSIIISLVLVEKLLTFVDFKQKPMVPKRYILLRENSPGIDISFDQKYIYRHFEIFGDLPKQDYRFRTDNDGYLLPSKIHENADLNIVFLGGSTTECMLVDESLRYPYLVGRQLEREMKISVNSYNSGVAGNNSLNSLDILLNKVIPLKPDYSVYMENINDLIILLNTRSYWIKNTDKGVITTPQETPMRLFAKRTFPQIYRVLSIFREAVVEPEHEQWEGYKGKFKTLDERLILERFEENLQAYINICRAYKIRPVLMTQFNRYKANPDPGVLRRMLKIKDELPGDSLEAKYVHFKRLYDKMNGKIIEVGKTNAIPVIDLAKKIPQEGRYIYDTIHLNNKGSQLASAFISGSLKEIIKKDLPEK